MLVQNEAHKKQGINSGARKGKQFLRHTWQHSSYSCYKPSDKSRMGKEPEYNYERSKYIRDHL